MSAYLHQCCDAPRWRCEQCHAPATWAENQYLTAPQEPSATPSTLERLLAEVDDALRREPTAHVYTMSGTFVRGVAAALRPSEGPPDDRDLPSAADVLGILAAPSEGPETGRQTVKPLESCKDTLTSMDRFVADRWNHAAADIVRGFANDLRAAIRREAKQLQALPAGPETGDRERRIMTLAKVGAEVNHWEVMGDGIAYGDGHDHVAPHACSHIDCVLVRQAAPAASEGQK